MELPALGSHLMKAGIYCYCGSAKGPGGLSARVSRHLNMKTKRFWHYDYLKEYLHIDEVWWQTGEDSQECEFAQMLANGQGAEMPIPGFGSSDCKKKCISHLIFFKNIQIINITYKNHKESGFFLTRRKVLAEEIC